MAEDRFDDLVKGVAEGRLSRRQAMKRVGAGLAGVIAAAVVPSAAYAAKPDSAGKRCGGAGPCPDGTTCCKIRGAHYCCPTGGLVNLGGCPGTQVLALNLGCTRVL